MVNAIFTNKNYVIVYDDEVQVICTNIEQTKTAYNRILRILRAELKALKEKQENNG